MTMTQNDVASATPLRTTAAQLRDGCRVLSEPEIDYADGSEQRMYEIVSSCSDVSAMSERLESCGNSIVEQYHVARSRANVLRALDLSADMRVLEVGAGCGAVTRYLGETCAVVDSIEPKAARARVARERARDLASVEVFVGGIEDVPPVPTYDVVLFCGVLEYVAGGAADSAAYIAVLEHARRVLAPGGVVVCAIENQLGVKYLAGAPEDHTGRPYDGLEGYGRGTHARTFSRRELEQLFHAASLHPRALHAFPDYKATRMVCTDQLLDDVELRHLAWMIPVFPSREWTTPDAWQRVDERQLWRSLVRAGIGDQAANSVIIVASADAEPAHDRLWPSTRHLSYFNVDGRATRYARRSDLVATAGGAAIFERHHLSASSGTATGALLHRSIDDPFVPGASLVDVVLHGDRATIDRHLATWMSELSVLVERAALDGSPVPLDFAPHNMIVGMDGRLTAIDQEWWWTNPATLEEALIVGMLTSAQAIAVADSAGRYASMTVGDLVADLCQRAGGSLTRAQLESCLPFAAQVHAEISTLDGAADADEHASIAAQLHELPGRSMESIRAERFIAPAASLHELREVRAAAASFEEHYRLAVAAAADAKRHYDALQQERDALHEERDALRIALDASMAHAASLQSQLPVPAAEHQER